MERQRETGGGDEMWECAGSNRMSSCSLPAPPTVRDSYITGVSACAFPAAGQLRVCPLCTAGEHVSSSTGKAIHHTSVSHTTALLLYYHMAQPDHSDNRKEGF